MKKFFLVFGALMILTACTEENKDPVVAIVNGIEVKKSEASTPDALEQKIEDAVVKTEAKHIGIDPSEMFVFFDQLKNRKIPNDQIDEFMKKEFKDKDLKPESREAIVKLMREKQFDSAKKKYISELKDRSTIWIVRDGTKTKYQTLQK